MGYQGFATWAQWPRQTLLLALSSHQGEGMHTFSLELYHTAALSTLDHTSSEADSACPLHFSVSVDRELFWNAWIVLKHMPDSDSIGFMLRPSPEKSQPCYECLMQSNLQTTIFKVPKAGILYTFRRDPIEQSGTFSWWRIHRIGLCVSLPNLFVSDNALPPLCSPISCCLSFQRLHHPNMPHKLWRVFTTSKSIKLTW